MTLHFDLNEQAYLPRIGFDEYTSAYMYTDTLRSLPVEVFVGGDPSPKGRRDTEKFLQMLRRSRENQTPEKQSLYSDSRKKTVRFL